MFLLCVLERIEIPVQSHSKTSSISFGIKEPIRFMERVGLDYSKQSTLSSTFGDESSVSKCHVLVWWRWRWRCIHKSVSGGLIVLRAFNESIRTACSFSRFFSSFSTVFFPHCIAVRPFYLVLLQMFLSDRGKGNIEKDDDCKGTRQVESSDKLAHAILSEDPSGRERLMRIRQPSPFPSDHSPTFYK